MKRILRRLLALVTPTTWSDERRETEWRNTFYQIVGQVTVAWAQLESQLDHSNLLLLRLAPGELRERHHPISLKPKLRFFARAHYRLPLLSGLAAAADALADDVRNLSDDRHNLIHGVLMRPLGRGPWEFYRFTHHDDDVRILRRTYDVDELLDLLDKTLTLAHRVSTHCITVLTLLQAEYPEQFLC